MPALTPDWSSLILLVFVLGLKHGFDADHLATIDGLTRWHSSRGAQLANYCGALFSAGHGLVVMAVAVGASLLASQLAVPSWFELTGSTCTPCCRPRLSRWWPCAASGGDG